MWTEKDQGSGRASDSCGKSQDLQFHAAEALEQGLVAPFVSAAWVKGVIFNRFFPTDISKCYIKSSNYPE